MTTNKKIFLLEDNEDLSFSLKEILDLERPNYHLISYANGNTAWEELSSNGQEYDIIILDNMVPGMSGMDILCKIKGNDNLRKKPVIIQSGKLEAYIEKKAKDSGASEYLIKPYSLIKFLEVLDYQLDNKEGN